MMIDDTRALVLKKLLDRALELMAGAYREARERGEDAKRIEQMVDAGRDLRAWQRAAEASLLPPPNARPFHEITASVERFAGKDSELYEAVLDSRRFYDEFGTPNPWEENLD